jgi:cation diffusion facilitator CzcD-associated flavoprotein CzcO
MAHVAERAGQVTLFQRTAPYVLPKPDRKITRAEHWMHRNIPLARKLVRGTVYSVFESLGVGLLKFRPVLAPLKAAWAAHLRLTIKDPALRARLTPDYPIGCKRILFDNTYYGALARPNVNVETGDIKEIGENYVVTNDGTRHEIDTLILGTGFAASGDFVSSVKEIKFAAGAATIEPGPAGILQPPPEQVADRKRRFDRLDVRHA